MSIAAKDGAWLSAASVQRFTCSKCGPGFYISNYPMNERETEAFIKDHINKKHGGISR